MVNERSGLELLSQGGDILLEIGSLFLAPGFTTINVCTIDLEMDMAKEYVRVAIIDGESACRLDGYTAQAAYRCIVVIPRGCERCHGVGYLGRVGIFEVLVVDPEVEKLILENRISEITIREAAEHQGMVTMAQDGLLKALDGITTVDEVFRVAE